jgi:hypothetical protein
MGVYKVEHGNNGRTIVERRSNEWRATRATLMKLYTLGPRTLVAPHRGNDVLSTSFYKGYILFHFIRLALRHSSAVLKRIVLRLANSSIIR